MKRVLLLARHDFGHALRDRLVWGAVILLGLMYLPSAGSIAASGHRPIAEYTLLIPYELQTYTLVVVAAVGYNSVVGERTAKTMKLIFGLPSTRRDLLLAKVLSRVVISLVATATILVIGNFLLAQGYGRPYLLPYWTIGAWMLLYVVVWTAVTVGYSAAFDSAYRTLLAIAGSFFLFSPDYSVWGSTFRPAFTFIFTGSLSTASYEVLAEMPLWYRVTERFNPLLAFWKAASWSVRVVGPGTPSGDFGETLALNLFGTLVFLGFGAVPLLFGYRRLTRRDLGDDSSSGQTRLRRYVGRVTKPARQLLRPTRWSDSRLWVLLVQDVRQLFRNRLVLGGIAVTALFVLPGISQSIDPSSAFGPREQVADISGAFSFAPLVLGALFGYRAIVGERAEKTLRVVLGNSATRRDVFVAKAVSRLTTAVLVLLPLFVFAELLVLVRFGHSYPVLFLTVVGSVTTLTLLWTTISLGFSAATSSPYRSIAGTATTFLFFLLFWGDVVRPVIGALTGTDTRGLHVGMTTPPAQFINHLSPLRAHTTLGRMLFPLQIPDDPVPGSVPLFVFSAVVVLTATTLPLYLGYRRFERVDL
ncbi:hypothetical protein C439_11843 [Haloferax mediterranei ATCC 33500]|nr:ABC transporter permease subunit [Haloferax mediterranei]AHZ23094.1 hypothetical protein BM92_10810 [Haloferax mediterranei ATCC 33500]EMA00027.1 hypothetical protein C439_11843 [Haloferax mediterranei ATCC 33500]MDX5987550.1 ABC transporter permease subunit [Haloferax mediterranei ATCC 33500]